MVNARRCLACKVLFESIDALNDHCALTTHPLKPHRCLPCDQAFTTPSGLQSVMFRLFLYHMHWDYLASKHLGSVKHQKRTQMSAQGSQASHDGAIQLVPDVTLITNNVEYKTQTVCRPCKLTFENHDLLFEHYRTSSSSRLHPYCPTCFQVFPKRKGLKKASRYQTRHRSHWFAKLVRIAYGRISFANSSPPQSQIWRSPDAN